jgi:hypothetical protein
MAVVAQPGATGGGTTTHATAVVGGCTAATVQPMAPGLVEVPQAEKRTRRRLWGCWLGTRRDGEQGTAVAIALCSAPKALMRVASKRDREGERAEGADERLVIRTRRGSSAARMQQTGRTWSGRGTAWRGRRGR